MYFVQKYLVVLACSTNDSFRPRLISCVSVSVVSSCITVLQRPQQRSRSCKLLVVETARGRRCGATLWPPFERRPPTPTHVVQRPFSLRIEVVVCQTTFFQQCVIYMFSNPFIFEFSNLAQIPFVISNVGFLARENSNIFTFKKISLQTKTIKFEIFNGKTHCFKAKKMV